jgi:large subunit ribosomal protein L13
MKTFLPSAKKEAKWFLINAQNIALGRICTRAAIILRGKDSPDYTPFFESGNRVVITNASQALLTGRKLRQKTYFSHSGYPGGQKIRTVEKMGWKKVVRNAVYGMLPKNRMRDKLIINLYVYEGPEHEQISQKPVEVKI